MADSKNTIIREKFIGSEGWLFFWVFVFWPAAIVYYFLRREPVEVKVININK